MAGPTEKTLVNILLLNLSEVKMNKNLLKALFRGFVLFPLGVILLAFWAALPNLFFEGGVAVVVYFLWILLHIGAVIAWVSYEEGQNTDDTDDTDTQRGAGSSGKTSGCGN